MGDYIHDILKSITRPPLPDQDQTKWREYNWGFTIYRTAYGGDTETSWQALLANIRAHVLQTTDKEHLGKFYPEGKYPEIWAAAPKVRELFRLDPRSDQTLLENASPDRLRELYKRGDLGPDGEPPVGHCMGSLERQGFTIDPRDRVPDNVDEAHPWVPRLFLVADAEVLAAVAQGKWWVKLFDVDYVAADHIPRHLRVGPQSYFGWTKMSTGSITGMWGELAVEELEIMIPRSFDPERRDVGVWHWHG